MGSIRTSDTVSNEEEEPNGNSEVILIPRDEMKEKILAYMMNVLGNGEPRWVEKRCRAILAVDNI